MRISECFTALNVGPDSQWNEVKRSYHFLAKKYHPDIHPGKPGLTTRFRQISEAYKTLEKRHKFNLQKNAHRKAANKPRNIFAEKPGMAESQAPQTAMPLGKKPTPMFTASKTHSIENAESRIRGVGATLFEMERKLFLLDIRKDIFLKKRLPSHSNVVRVKKGNESFQVRVPPGPWTQMFIRVPEKGNKSMFSKRRGDLLLNIHVPESESPRPAPATYYYKVRIPKQAIGTDKVWTLKSATGPIKFTLPNNAQDGQKLTLKANRNATGPSCASHIMTLDLV